MASKGRPPPSEPRRRKKEGRRRRSSRSLLLVLDKTTSLCSSATSSSSPRSSSSWFLRLISSTTFGHSLYAAGTGSHSAYVLPVVVQRQVRGSMIQKNVVVPQLQFFGGYQHPLSWRRGFFPWSRLFCGPWRFPSCSWTRWSMSFLCWSCEVHRCRHEGDSRAPTVAACEKFVLWSSTFLS